MHCFGVYGYDPSQRCGHERVGLLYVRMVTNSRLAKAALLTRFPLIKIDLESQERNKS
jgi:hypothetical protein